eukprot:1314828-Prymnesium_polylepis.1
MSGRHGVCSGPRARAGRQAPRPLHRAQYGERLSAAAVIGDASPGASAACPRLYIPASRPPSPPPARRLAVRLANAPGRSAPRAPSK